MPIMGSCEVLNGARYSDKAVTSLSSDSGQSSLDLAVQEMDKGKFELEPESGGNEASVSSYADKTSDIQAGNASWARVARG